MTDRQQSRFIGRNAGKIHSNYSLCGSGKRPVHTISLNTVVTAEEKRQLIDTLYGAMIQMAHAGNDGFAAIDKALGK